MTNWQDACGGPALTRGYKVGSTRVEAESRGVGVERHFYSTAPEQSAILHPGCPPPGVCIQALAACCPTSPPQFP